MKGNKKWRRRTFKLRPTANSVPADSV